MVGDGIRNVTLRTTKPLNDNEWHYVEAEINVKMARLKVDFYPPAIHKFPGQTYITMEFTQPLLVGAKTSYCGVSDNGTVKGITFRFTHGRGVRFYPQRDGTVYGCRPSRKEPMEKIPCQIISNSFQPLGLWRLVFLCAGAANHTLRPFLGCLRGLRMNGVPVDLEGKVDERTGIRRNCTGACLNASIPCRNGGQCIDGYASYSCDCNNTAFDGYYCQLGESSNSFA